MTCIATSLTTYVSH